jgi:hypothetical protein
MDKPIFFIGGAQRSGTTYLYSVMDQHPEICMAKPATPEPKFFLNLAEVARGEKYYLEKFYSPNHKTKVLGEKSTSYIESVDAGQRIKAMFPEAKMIFILRNPVARAISNYFFSVSNGLEKRSLHDVFIKKKPLVGAYSTSVSPFNYIGRGEYFAYLKAYQSVFAEGKIKIILFEQVVNSAAVVRDLFEFVGVDPSITSGMLREKINASEETFDVDPIIIETLTRHFEPHNEKLEEYLGISLGLWEENNSTAMS